MTDQCEGDDCPLCYLDAEIVRLTTENNELDDLNYIQAGMIAEFAARNAKLEAALQQIANEDDSYYRVGGTIAEAALKEQT